MMIPIKGNYIISQSELKKYDYVIVAFWAKSLGYFSRQQLVKLEDYIDRHPENNFLLLKANWGEMEENSSGPNVNVKL
jgi:hypothetical protein